MQFAKAKYFKIGRRGTVIGPVQADKLILSERATAEDLYGEEIIIEERARARNVYGESIFIEEKARITGDIEYTSELSVESGAELSKEPKKVKAINYPDY